MNILHIFLWGMFNFIELHQTYRTIEVKFLENGQFPLSHTIFIAINIGDVE